MNYIQQLFSLKDKVALVTGAANGNGKAIAKGIAKAGAEVLLVDVDPSVRDLSYDLNQQGNRCFAYVCDLSNKKDVDNLIKQVRNDHKNISVLINNAGVTFGQDVLEYSDDSWDKTYKINLLAPYKLSQGIAKIMVDNKTKGSIINITSLNSEMAFPDNPAYVASKGALKQLTKSFALDLGKYDIRCNNIGPGYMKTNMTKGSWSDLNKRKDRQNRTSLGRWGDPDDLCGAVIFLSSNASSYITGQDIYVDGGWLIKGL